MRTEVAFAELTAKGLSHVYPSKGAVQLCGGSGKIISVTVRAAEEGETPTHWGWDDYRDQTFHMIWPREFQVRMCSPDEFHRSEKEGLGKVVPLVVSPVDPLIVSLVVAGVIKVQV